jgi:hypothetical protein
MRILFAILLLLNLSASAQDGGYFLLRPAVSEGGGSSDTTYILDTITGDAAAYGLRLLHTAYTGPLVTIRRSTDNTLLSIYPTATGEFDATSFSTFIGAGTGYIVTWYDQSGGGWNATQATAANQPQLILSGQNGKPVLSFDGTDYLDIAGTSALFKFLHNAQGTVTMAVKPGTSSNPDALYPILCNNNGSSSLTGYSLFYDDRSSQGRNNTMVTVITKGVTNAQIVADVINNTIPGGSFSLVNSLVDAPNTTASLRHAPYVNNVAVTSLNTYTNTVTPSDASNYMFIGATSSLSTFFTGQMAEVIIHNRKISTSELGQLNTNLKNY